MPRMQIVAKIDTKLNSKFINGIYEGAKKVLEVMSDKLATEMPDVWSASGRMQEELEIVGLDTYTKPEALRMAWWKTIEEVKIDRRYNQITINLFNSRTLDEDTKWIGTNDIPLFNTKIVDGEWKTTGLSNNVSLLLGDSAYRPISNGPNKYWYWNQNPYPGHGYWMLYEQGSGGYEPRNFIKTAYNYMFGTSVANLFNESGVKFNDDVMKKFNDKITKKIKEQVEK